MLIDTHCHINMIVKNTFDSILTQQDIQSAKKIIENATLAQVTKILNVGTSLIESRNCITLAQKYDSVCAAIGIHPNDCTAEWRSDIDQLKKLLSHKEKNKIVAIGECGIDFHYPDYDLQRQKDAFKTQIDLALEHDLALVVHTRDAGEVTLRCLEEFKNSGLRGTIHCFSEDLYFAKEALAMGFMLGIGGTITYPKNNQLRDVVTTVGLEHILLETDAPFLPPQSIRGQQNSPAQIRTIAEYIAQLLTTTFDTVAQETTKNAEKVFKF